MRQRRTVIRRRIVPGPGLATRSATRKSRGKKKLSRLKMATSTTTGTSPGNSTQVDWEEEADLETFLAEESDWFHRDALDSDVLLMHTWKKSAVLTRA